MLHFTVEPDLKQGLRMMKYAVNQEWKFRSFKAAFVVGFLQFSISLTVEVVNYLIIFVASTTVIDVVADFLVILVISEFDDYMFAISGTEYFKNLITERKYSMLFRVETTSSDSA